MLQQFVAERVGASRLALGHGDGQARSGNTRKKKAPGRLTEGYRGSIPCCLEEQWGPRFLTGPAAA
jgi:hypothetical protein